MMSKEGDRLQNRAADSFGLDPSTVGAIYVTGARLADLLAEIRDRLPEKAEPTYVAAARVDQGEALCVEPRPHQSDAIRAKARAERDREIVDAIMEFSYGNNSEWGKGLQYAAVMIQGGLIPK